MLLSKFFKSAKRKEIFDILEVNDSVLVALPALPKSLYNSKVVDVAPNRIGLALPLRNGMRLPLRKKMKVCVSVVTKKGRINFISKVADVTADGKNKMVKITMPNNFRAEQLRRFFRLPVHNMNVRIVTARESIPATVSNLSAGGCLLHTQSRNFEVGDRVKIDFSDTNLSIWELEARIIRMNISGIAFEFITSEAEREKIAKYVFRRQLEHAV